MSIFMSSIKAILIAPLHHFIHKDFHEVVARMTLIDGLLFLIIHFIDKLGIWHRLPVFLGLIYLAIRRHLHEEYNLFNVGETPVGVRFNPADFPFRTADGKFNDPFNEGAGSQGTFFGRNVLPVDQKDKLKKPDPMVVATKLLARRSFIDTGKQFNMIAASWIQFMIHDWIDHLEDTNQIELTAPREVANQCPLKSFKFYKSKEVPTGFYEIKTGFKNIRTPWWDGSAIYGSNAEKMKKVRTFKDGKLKISKDGLLLHDEDGTAVSGDIRNSWAGVSTLQALFVKEHNAVCDALKKKYPHLEDEDLYRHARLVTSAVIAKIHTIDWTVELLKTDTLLAGMRANWYGLLGKKFKDTFGHIGGAILGGLVGLKKPNNHGVPYSLTEEFVSVYRMHSLLPDHLLLRNINAAPGPNKSAPLTDEVPMPNLIGHKGEKTLSEIGFTRQMVSMGHQACGALELWNYPLWLRDIIPQDVDGKDRPDHVDLAALEVYRDRERKVARYNEFRRALLLIPISKWEDLTDDNEAIDTLHEVYGDDVEELDLLVGLMAEKKIKGFAISETAFIIFLLMASRRLEGDRFFTSYFNEETYTKEGLEWIIHSIDKLGIWLRLPVFLGILYLAIRRHLHEEYNLFNVGKTPVGVRFNPADFPFRTADGKFNDPFNEGSGSQGTFFGRNVLPVDQKDKLMKPDPMVVATMLLARRNFIDTGKQFNMIAASWIQFMIHDWIDHLEDTNQIELTAPREVANQCPLKSFKFYKSKEVPTGFYEIKSGFLNIRTPWWDGSVIYGSNAEKLKKVRTFKDGKLKISKDGLLLHDEDGSAVSGDVRNSWAGVSILQALFIKEHNAVCDAFKKKYPELGDEDLYRHARLVTSAVIAKIHTIDWTVELLKSDTLLAGMRVNWHIHQEYNLFNVGTTPRSVRFNPADYPFRTADGKYNDPFDGGAGSQGTFFGRNVLPVDQKDKLMKPDPMLVATKLLAQRVRKVRSFEDGKLKISKDGLLLHDKDGIALSGDTRNSWAGVSTLQALFIKEHNAVCDALKKKYPELDDEDLYRHARLVTSAVIAKIHTIDWTVELLKTVTLLAAMRANWYGLLGKKFKDSFGHVGGAILGGLVGQRKPNNRGVPYSLTEEFVSVYRMHSLLPDHFLLRDITAAPGLNKSPPLTEKDIIPQDVDDKDRPDPIDLPALEIYRDRERKVARYNEFRRALLLIPISKWKDLTDDNEVIATLHEVYGDDVEELDLLVGLMAEKKIKGFAISETAFTIFLVMATRMQEVRSR
ncbi:hypothetical protein F0562_004975 [Nyssa sinensis]|uniref:Uncharacterized protein n=1 Tax=Nyssa sinensis TaxID=561372 RepID=A0A5J5AKS8_9ASTE|nr:hypothetical protein F0562_004975 [Nyssa sinensis]